MPGSGTARRASRPGWKRSTRHVTGLAAIRQTVERTCAVYVGLTGGKGRHGGADKEMDVPPLKGSTAELADAMRQYAAAGISHVQLVLDPITVEAIEEFGPVLAELDRG